MGTSSFDRRQWWPYGQLADYGVRARIIGFNPTLSGDLVASTLLAVVFAVLGAACFLVGRDKAYRIIPIYTLFAASLFLFLAFAIRAGVANTPQPSRLSLILECILLVGAHLFVIDVWVSQARDILLDYLEIVKGVDLRGASVRGALRGVVFDSNTRGAFIARFLVLPLCLILYIVGYATIPEPFMDVSAHSVNLRGVASFFIILVLAISNVVMALCACWHLLPWVPQVMLFGISIFLWLPAIYGFCMIAVTPVTLPSVCTPAFFYAGFGIGLAISIAVLLFMFRGHWFWRYRYGPEYAPPDGLPRIRDFAYLPPPRLLS